MSNLADVTRDYTENGLVDTGNIYGHTYMYWEFRDFRIYDESVEVIKYGE